MTDRRTQQASTTLYIEGVEVLLTRKRVKNVNLRIGRDGIVKLSAPARVPLSEIEGFVRSRIDWIVRAQQRVARHSIASQRWENEDILMLWGEALTLRVCELPAKGARPKMTLTREGQELVLQADERVCGPAQEAVLAREKAIQKWLREQLQQELPAIFSRCEEVVGRHCSGWRLRTMKSRWGSCNVRTGIITINTELVAYEPRCLEYVVTHELCHLIEANHSARFYAQMDCCFPEWRLVKAILSGRVG